MYKCRNCNNLEHSKESVCPKCGAKDAYFQLNKKTVCTPTPPIEKEEETEGEEYTFE